MAGSERFPDLKQILSNHGLDAEYWAENFAANIGITQAIQLRYADESELNRLRKHVRFPWEKKALRQVLAIDVDSDDGDQMSDVNSLLASTSIQLPKDNQAKSTAKASDDKGKGSKDKKSESTDEALLSLLKSALKPSSKKKGVKLIAAGPLVKHASGSHVLRGFLKSNDYTIMGLRRDIVLAPPSDEYIKLLGPQIPKQEGTVEITSKEMSQQFSAFKSVFGFTAAVSVAAKGAGIKAGGGVDYAKKKKREMETTQEDEKVHYEMVKYSLIPVKCCQLDQHTLQFSKEALWDLSKIDLAISESFNARKKREDENDKISELCREFLEKYGSHVSTGTVHFGGTYEWKSEVDGLKSQLGQSYKKDVADAIKIMGKGSGGAMGFGVDVEASVGVDNSNSSGGSSKKASESNTVKTSVVQVGGPVDCKDMDGWRKGLAEDKLTWAVVDRGQPDSKEMVPVWEILRNSNSEGQDGNIRFENRRKLIERLRRIYEEEYEFVSGY